MSVKLVACVVLYNPDDTIFENILTPPVKHTDKSKISINFHGFFEIFYEF